MANIGAIGNLNPVEALDLDAYKDAQEGPKIPRAGRYTLRAPDTFSDTAFGATKAGFLSVQIDPTIVGPTSQGYVLRYTKLSAKTYERGGSKVSQIGDYLRAVGIRARVSGDPQALADAVESTAGALFEADLDWEVNHYQSGFKVKGMTSFPRDDNGNYQPWIVHPTEKDAEGQPLRLRANIVVRRFVPPAN